jgi:hypothetical protein
MQELDGHNSTFSLKHSTILCLFVYANFIVQLLFSFVRLSALFDSVFYYSVFDYSVFDYSVYFSVLILELYSRYFDPYFIYIQYINNLAVNEHHTADSAIFVLV